MTIIPNPKYTKAILYLVLFSWYETAIALISLFLFLSLSVSVECHVCWRMCLYIWNSKAALCCAMCIHFPLVKSSIPGMYIGAFDIIVSSCVSSQTLIILQNPAMQSFTLCFYTASIYAYDISLCFFFSLSFILF